MVLKGASELANGLRRELATNQVAQAPVVRVVLRDHALNEGL